MPPVHSRLVALENSAELLRREVAGLRAEFAILSRLCQDVINMDKHRAEYIAWLRERRAARLKS